MIQEIITYFILITAASFAIRNVIRFFTKKEDICQSCAHLNTRCKIARQKKSVQNDKLARKHITTFL